MPHLRLATLPIQDQEAYLEDMHAARRIRRERMTPFELGADDREGHRAQDDRCLPTRVNNLAVKNKLNEPKMLKRS